MVRYGMECHFIPLHRECQSNNYFYQKEAAIIDPSLPSAPPPSPIFCYWSKWIVGGIRGSSELRRLVTGSGGGGGGGSGGGGGGGGSWELAFCMFPVSIDQVMRVADADELMPPKVLTIPQASVIFCLSHTYTQYKSLSLPLSLFDRSVPFLCLCLFFSCLFVCLSLSLS